MKKTFAALATAAALTLTPVAAGATAHAAAPVDGSVSASAADTQAKARGCVTRAEYRKVKKGMSKAKVHRIFGTAGMKVSKQGNLEARGYKGCPRPRSGVGIAYLDGKVASKAAQW